MTPRYKLRTLLILLAVLPPVLAFGWWRYSAWRAEQERLEALKRLGPGIHYGLIPDFAFKGGASTVTTNDSAEPSERLGIELPQ